jgi:hypothetical protein
VLLEQLAKTNAAYITKAAKIRLGSRFILIISRREFRFV